MNNTISRFGSFVYKDKVFLGMEELSRNQTFFNNYIKLLLSFGGYGILTKDSFVVERGSSINSIRISKSLAIDKNSNLIFKEDEDNIIIPQNRNYWLAISANKTTIEEGICSISSTGEVVGVGTKFLSLLRGVLSYKQSRIKFTKADGTELRNNQIYTVVEVVDNNNIMLDGSFTEESNLRYSVVGTFVKDILPADPFIYAIDGCLLERFEGNVDTIPIGSGIDNINKFAIAHVTNVGGIVTVQDKRDQFYPLLDEFIQPQSWQSATDIENGIFVTSDENIYFRKAQFDHYVEIRGKFRSNKAGGRICSLGDDFVSNEDNYIHALDDTGRTFVLKLSSSGVLSVLNEENGLNENTNIVNIIPSQIFSKT